MVKGAGEVVELLETLNMITKSPSNRVPVQLGEGIVYDPEWCVVLVLPYGVLRSYERTSSFKLLSFVVHRPILINYTD